MHAHPAPTLTQSAAALLAAMRGPDGIHASLTATANYRAVFTRDAVMAGVAGLLTGDPVVVEGLVWTLERLRDLQGPEGQVPSNYLIEGDGPPRVSFGTLAPRLDAVGWYLVGIGLAARAGALDPAPFRESVRRAARVLDAIEYNGRGLVNVPPGGDWADEWIYDGYVLHDQLLRAWGLDLCGDELGEPAWRDKAAVIMRAVDRGFWPADAAEPGRPIAGFSPTRRYDMFDLASCSLLAVSGLLPARGEAALDWICREWLEEDRLPPAFHPVIEEGDPEWPALARYHLHGFRNRPHEYHNGGIWPVWLGWLALALGRTGRTGDLAQLRALWDAALRRAGEFHFEEYLHGRTGQPGGTRQMAYTATGVLFLAHADDAAAQRLFAS